MSNFLISDDDIIYMRPYVPTWGAEKGRQMLLMTIKTKRMTDAIMLKYDPSTDTASLLDMQEDNHILALAYAPEVNTTFLIGNRYGELSRFSPCKTWGTNNTPQAIQAEIETHLIRTDELPYREKYFKQVFTDFVHQENIKFELGYDGVPPSLDLAFSDEQNAWMLPERAAHAVQLRFRRNEGGQPLLGGSVVEWDPSPVIHPVSWLGSRRESVDYMMTEAPLIVPGVSTPTAGTNQFTTITHNLGWRPKAVIACVCSAAAGTAIIPLITQITDTTFTVYLKGTIGSFARLHWVAVRESVHLNDSGVMLASVALPTIDKYFYQQHNFLHYLSAITEAGVCFYSKRENVDNHIYTYADDFELGASSGASGTVDDRAFLANFYYGSLDNYFRVGNVSVPYVDGTDDVIITHNLGRIPTVAIVQFDNTMDPVGKKTFTVFTSGTNWTTTTFKVTVTTLVGTDTAGLRWLVM